MAKRKTAKSPKAESLLIELLTEELPPKSLKRLSIAFADAISDYLRDGGFIGNSDNAEEFATPRRLAALIPNVRSKQPDGVIDRRGPAVQSGLDATGKPTPALIGFARSCGTEPEKLTRRKEDKGEYFVYRVKKNGEPLENHLANYVEQAIKRLPVAKLMRWGEHDAEFVRPIHGVVLLRGSKVVPGTVLGIRSGNETFGHRFLSKSRIKIKSAADYEQILERQGQVIASFQKRRELIAKQLDKLAAKFGKGTAWQLGHADDLIDEVTSIVEYPSVYTGAFESLYLELPRECLIVSMQQHQRYFPLVDARGEALAKFLFVANMHPANPAQIVHGNERVLRARLSDAKFFFDQDHKTKLADRVPRLASVVYHNKLGSQLDRVQRIQKIAAGIAGMLGATTSAVERAAFLAKADLLTDMVGEFPELQGTMGRYYARHDGEAAEVADAIEQHYFPRAAGAPLPEGPVAVCVALADKLDLLAGMFSIGQQPTGDKDPFGLRRAALGVIRIVVEKRLPLSSNDLVNLAFAQQPGPRDAGTDLLGFLSERLRGYLREQGHSAQEVDTVLSAGSLGLSEVTAVLEAIKKFQRLPEAADLTAAYKRIDNIIKKAGVTTVNADANVFAEPAERALYDALQGLKPDVESRFRSHDYAGALQALAKLKKPVDAFFDQVMVMAEDARLRDNRLALLGDLKTLMNRVADISKLAA